MKKYIIPFLLMGALIIGGCGQEDDQQTQIDQPIENEQATGEVVIEPPVNPESQEGDQVSLEKDEASTEALPLSSLMQSFEDMVEKPSTTAVQVAKFIEKNVSEATIGEMDYMVAMLMVYQTEYMDLWNDLAYEEAYMDALNNDMGGILESDYIAAIESDEVRDFYNDLDKGYMTIVRYEETPVVEMDWNKLSLLGPVFSEGFNYIIEARGFESTIDYSDYYAVAEAIVDLEGLLENEDSYFVKQQLLELITIWSSYLSMGPEGTFVDYYMIKEGDLYEAMIRFSEDYPGSDFGRFIGEVVAADIGNFIELSKAYDRYVDGLSARDYEWIYRTDEDTLTYVRRIGYKSNTSEQVKQKINGALQGTVNQILEEVKDYAPYRLNARLGYDDGKWATVIISSSYQLSETEQAYMSKALTVDLTTGQQVDLADYLHLSDKEALGLINELSGLAFVTLPDLQLTTDGIYLESQGEDVAGNLYSAITDKDLLPYRRKFTFEEVAVDRFDKRPQDLLIASLEEMLLSDMMADDYVDYLIDNIGQASTEEAEKMIEALMIFQSDLMDASDDWFNLPDYRSAAWALIDEEDDIEVIDDIDDESVRQYFQQISDAYLRVRNDEDILYLTLDWSKIAQLDGNFSEAFQYVIDMRSNYNYRFTEDYYDLAKLTVRLEVMEDKVISSFVKAEMEALYDTWASELLIGSVGNNFSAYANKSGALYEEMMRFAQEYSSSALGRFLLTLEEEGGFTDDQLSDHMTAFIISENLGAKKWVVEEVRQEGNEVQSFLYQEIGKSEKSDHINRVIGTVIKNLSDYAISKSTLETPDYKIYMFPVYSDSRYVSFYTAIEFQASATDKDKYGQTLTIDMKIGQKLELDSYLNIYTEQAIAIINNLLGSDYTTLPYIQLTETGMLIEPNEMDTYQTDYDRINRRTLVPYIGLEHY